MLGLGSSLSGGSFVDEKFNYVSLHSDNIFTGNNAYLAPVTVESTTSISLDDTLAEDYGEVVFSAATGALFYMHMGSAVNVLTSGTDVTVSGRITLQGTGYHAETDNNNGHINIILKSGSGTSNLCRVYVDSDYGGTVISQGIVVDENGYFSKPITLDADANALSLWASNIVHNPDDVNKKILISRLSITT